MEKALDSVLYALLAMGLAVALLALSWGVKKLCRNHLRRKQEKI